MDIGDGLASVNFENSAEWESNSKATQISKWRGLLEEKNENRLADLCFRNAHAGFPVPG